DGASEPSALVGGYHLAFWIGTALVAVAITVAAIVVESPDEVSEGAEAPDGIEPRQGEESREPAFSTS
ncbi:MAG TPA: hypothetical protein VD766_01985, partial [Solirubrobacterales bacterium]|nr:hypothetical protein [Solirubrobacterales bacterium]